MKKCVLLLFVGVFCLSYMNHLALAEGTGNSSREKPVYRQGTLFPKDKGEQCIATVNRLYSEWKEKYFRYSPYDTAQAYINWQGEEGITVSEAHGYGMLILAYLAADDENARQDFDATVNFYLAHPSDINPALMAWQQDDNGNEIIDINGVDSATDGDLDIAYALLLAHERWGSEGTHDYLELAKRSINATMESVVNREHWILLTGDWAYEPLSESWYRTRPSDFMLGHFAAFERATGDKRWSMLSDRIVRAIHQLVETESKETGLLPDFAVLKNESFESENDSYSWDACRVPWRLATAALTENITDVDDVLKKINLFALVSSGGDPAQLCCGYLLNGQKLVDYLDPAFAAPFMVSAMVGENELFLNDLWDWNMRQKTRNGGYYDNSIRLLCAIVASGQWWTPCQASERQEQ